MCVDFPGKSSSTHPIMCLWFICQPLAHLSGLWILSRDFALQRYAHLNSENHSGGDSVALSLLSPPTSWNFLPRPYHESGTDLN